MPTFQLIATLKTPTLLLAKLGRNMARPVMVLCKVFFKKDLLGGKFSLYNPLEVESKSLLKSLGIRVFHRGVIASI